MRKAIFSLFFFLFIASVAFAQGLTIKGVVSDEMGEPLPGANVVIPALNIGGAAAEDGTYAIFVPSSNVNGQAVDLMVSFVGYKKQTLSVVLNGNVLEQDFELEEDVFQSEAVVVTGIASKTSKEIAEVAVSRIPVTNYTELTSYQDFSQLVTGKVAGVQMQTASGNVGGGWRFFMRSGGGINGNEQPVIYVDGVRVDNTQIVGYGVGGQGMSTLANLNPEDIENIQILKGPAGAAMYGTQGSNGVVLITTKSGKLKAGATTGVAVDYKYIYGYNSQSYEYSEDDFVSAKDANRIFRDGLIRQHTVSASGGVGFLRYFASFDNRDEDGIINNNHMNRTALRTNIVAVPSEKLRLQFNAGYTMNNLSRPNNDNNIYGYLGNTLLFSSSYVFTDSASIEGLKDENKNNQFVGSAKLTYNPIKNLEVNLSAGVDATDWRQDMTFPASLPYSFVPAGRRRIWNRTNTQFTYDFNAQYRYSFMDNLNVTSIVGAQLFNRKNQTSFLTSETFDTDLITDIGAGADVTGYGEGKSHSKTAGIFTEHSFAYKNQYYMTLGLRQDYASSIGAKAPSIIYPKASLAVRMDKYDFFPKMFNLMKLRFAYGESGTLPGSRDPIALLWTAATSGYGAGAVLSGIGNTEIKPERIKEFEVGFEAELFKNYALEFTYYKQFATNSIIGFRNSPSTGRTASSVPFNIGALKSWGIETLLQTTPWRTRDFELNLSAIFNYQTNEVTDLGGAQPIYDGFDLNVIKEGMRKHEFYTYEVLGPKFNTDGTYAGVDVSSERKSYGNPIPSTTGSFTLNFRAFKHLNLYILADWAIDYQVFNNTDIFAARFGNKPRYNTLKAQLDLTSSMPEVTRLTPGTQAYKDAASEYAFKDWHYDANYVFDADYFKSREISLSYSLVDLLPLFAANMYVKDIIVGVSARNVWTSSKYPGADVEVNFAGSRSLSRGQDFLTLQNPRTYNFWVRLGL